jgi:DNA (cytosine-5)-methyltransferase 1
MKVLDIFSGIGGMSLGLQRAGFETVAFCEIDDWCRRVLAKHWPKVPIYDDVRNLNASRLRADGIDRIHVIAGGFPCQDVSAAGEGAGLEGERSGLWRECSRLVGELRPDFVIVENVGALLARGLADILGELSALGYDAEWHALPAAAIGAPHLRDRVWIIARARSESARVVRGESCELCGFNPVGVCAWRPSTDAFGCPNCNGEGMDDAAADTSGGGLANVRGLFGSIARALAAASASWERPTEPPLRRVDDAVSPELDARRVKAIGNAVVPLFPEIIGRAIMETWA